MTSEASLRRKKTTVPVVGGEQATVEPGDFWPSSYRGSRYSLVDSQKHGTVVKWSHMGAIQAMTYLPEGLQRALRDFGKIEGKGSFRVTASGEVLTKIHSDNYRGNDDFDLQGFVPVYVGQIEGDFDFEDFSNDPETSSDVSDLRVWSGLPFNHGERWSVTTKDKLVWRWEDFNFESAFEHPGLAKRYKSLRPEGGRIYINEHGHVWGNVDRETVPSSLRDEVMEAFNTWKRSASNAEKRLVQRRLERTKDDGAENGLLPMHIGHLSQFDEGLVPKPVVTHDQYFENTARERDE
jgi:hypothetical protein